MNLFFDEHLDGIGLDETESRLLFNFDLERAEKMDADIKRSLEKLDEMAKATGRKQNNGDFHRLRTSEMKVTILFQEIQG